MNGDKLPPHDTDAEEAVIGSLLIDGSSIHKVATILQPTDFHSERNSMIYGACLSLYERDEAIDQSTVAQELDRQGKLESCGGAANLSHLIANCPTSLDIEHYGQIVYRLSIMRRLIAAGGQIANIGYRADPDVDSSLNDAEDVLFRLRHGQSRRDLTHIRQVLDHYFETTSEAEGETREPIPYVLSGYAGLDEFLGGFQRSDLIIVGGRPSMGKTSLALSLARNAAVEQGACVALSAWRWPGSRWCCACWPARPRLIPGRYASTLTHKSRKRGLWTPSASSPRLQSILMTPPSCGWWR
jgi:replicative DNA helicase